MGRQRVNKPNCILNLVEIDNFLTPEFLSFLQFTSLWYEPFPQKCIAFLNFKWKTEDLGCIYIEVDITKKLGQLFCSLCIGDREITHKGSKNLRLIGRVIDDSSTEECVVAGTFDARLVDNFRDIFANEYTITCSEVYLGDIFIEYSRDLNNLARFYIALGDLTDKEMVIGKVIDNLDIIKKVAAHKAVEHVEISDCGIAIPI